MEGENIPEKEKFGEIQRTPGNKIIHGSRDALLGILSYVWWKFLRRSTKLFENCPMMGDAANIIEERNNGIKRKIEENINIQSRIRTYWNIEENKKYEEDYNKRVKEMKDYAGQVEKDSYYISDVIQRYDTEIENAKAKIFEAIQKVKNGVKEELKILKDLLSDKEEEQQGTSD